MVNIGDSNWELNPGDEILKSRNASDLRSKLEKGVTITLRSSDGTINKRVKVNAPTFDETISQGFNEPWAEVAKKTHAIFTSFVEGVVISGMLDPLLVEKPIEGIAVKKLHLSQTSSSQELKYYESSKEEKSIEEKAQHDTNYQTAAKVLHESDETKKEAFSKYIEEAKHTQEFFVKHGPQQKKAGEQQFLKDLESVKDEASLVGLLKKHQIALLSDKLTKDPEAKKLIADEKIKSLVDKYLCREFPEESVFKKLAFAEDFDLPLLKEQAKRAIKSLDAHDLCQNIKQAENISPSIEKLILEKLCQNPAKALIALKSESNEAIKSLYWKTAIIVLQASVKQRSFYPEHYDGYETHSAFSIVIDILKEEYGNNIDGLREFLKEKKLDSEQMDDCIAAVQVARVEEMLRKYPSDESGFKELDKLLTDKPSEKLKDQLFSMCLRVEKVNPQLKKVAIYAYANIDRFIKEMGTKKGHDKDLHKDEKDQSIGPYKQALDHISRQNISEIVSTYLFIHTTDKAMKEEYTSETKDLFIQMLKSTEKGSDSEKVFAFLNSLRDLDKPDAPEEVKDKLTEIISELKEEITLQLNILREDSNEILKLFTSEDPIQSFKDSITINLEPRGLFSLCEPELLKGVSSTDLLELDEIISHWKNCRVISDKSSSLKEYSPYIHKLALTMQRYQKSRRSFNPDINPIIFIEKLRKELDSDSDKYKIPSADIPFIKGLLHQDYRLDYFKPETEVPTEGLHISGEEKAMEPLYTAPGSKYSLEILRDGNCALNSFIINILGLIHEGKYPEEELIRKFSDLDDGSKEIYLEYKDTYTSDKPFDELFNNENQEVTDAKEEIQRIFSKPFRALLIDYYSKYTEGRDTKALFEGIISAKGDVELQTPEEVPYQVKEQANALHNGLLNYFKAGLYHAASGREEQLNFELDGDFFKYSKGLITEATEMGKNWYDQLPREKKQQLDKQASNFDKNKLIDNWLMEDLSTLESDWLPFLKASHKTYLESLSKDKVWLQPQDLGALGELFSTPDIRVNVLLRLEKEEYSSTTLTKIHFGKFPTLNEFSETELSFLGSDEVGIISKDHFLECPRQKIIRIFDEQIQKGEAGFLAKKLNKKLSKEGLSNYITEFKKRVLREYDENYLKNGERFKKPRSVTMGIFYDGENSHFESLVSKYGRFDLSSDTAQIASSQKEKTASYDELDRWEKICEEVNLLLRTEEKVTKEEIYHMLGRLDHKIFSLGGKENCPQDLLDMRKSILDKYKIFFSS